LIPQDTVEHAREREAHLTDYYRILRKHRWLVAGLFLLTVLTVTVWTFVQTPIYQASATVLIEPEAAKVLNIQEVTSIGAPTQEYYRTQYEIITSRPILQKVVDVLNLKKRVPAIGEADDPAAALASRVTVEPKRNTRLVLVKAEHPDPALAADIANAVARQYAKHNLDIKLKGAQDALAWLTEQMTALKDKVQESSVALQNYRVKVGILGMQEQRQITAAKIMDFNKAYLEAQAQRLSVEAKMNELARVAGDKGGSQTIFTVADNALIQKLKAEASDLEVQKSKLMKIYKDKHPEVLKVQAQMDQVAQRIDAEIKTMLRLPLKHILRCLR
jgi:succinoglycan biosynthesis transport protein ExoP